MSRTVYLNGEWLEEADAKISIFDRGYTFADAIYEVTAIVGGKLIDYPGHSARMQRSLGELGMVCPLDENELLAVHREIVARNNVEEGMIYLQISRGVDDRDFVYPKEMKPTFSMFTQTKKVLENPYAKSGISVISLPDWRWERRDIKTVQLLYPTMAKTQASRQGADDAWLLEDGFVTEASSATAHIVKKDGTLVTRNLSHVILPGITRASTLDLAREAGIKVEERPFTLEEAKEAAEAFNTSATNFVLPVVSIDGQKIGDGTPGPITKKLRDIYVESRLATAI
ncbi:D-amino-acid transaminase [uncultured Cohaesibacter sp.]|uniref:D-amino-acid transaminase n=1 Tax=uncultured Cohaesibacter sp. TaxID=1002546 RepID=UPI002AAB2C0F|nr:D-amino-acid transaminase [uncultured Cohaesibacter sp.]